MPASAIQSLIKNQLGGQHPDLLQIKKQLELSAVSDVPILILGEPGTGRKELAEIIHQLSNRKSLPLTPLDCAMLPDMVAEMNPQETIDKQNFFPKMIRSINNGTLYMNDINLLTPLGQQRLCKFVERGEVRLNDTNKLLQMNLRLVCSASSDFIQTCEKNQFLSALYHRLSVFQFRLPALRERIEDLPQLAKIQMEKISRRHRRPPPQLPADTLAVLASYHWPGNLIELESTLERALILSQEKSTIQPDTIYFHSNSSNNSYQNYSIEKNTGNIRHLQQKNIQGPSLEEYFQRFVLEHQEKMSETELARKLGISRKCLWERRQRFNLPRKNNPS